MEHVHNELNSVHETSVSGFLMTPAICNISEIDSNSLATLLLKKATVRDEESEGEAGLDPEAARDQGTGSITTRGQKRVEIFRQLQSHMPSKTVYGSKGIKNSSSF